MSNHRPGRAQMGAEKRRRKRRAVITGGYLRIHKGWRSRAEEEGDQVVSKVDSTERMRGGEEREQGEERRGHSCCNWMNTCRWQGLLLKMTALCVSLWPLSSLIGLSNPFVHRHNMAHHSMVKYEQYSMGSVWLHNYVQSPKPCYHSRVCLLMTIKDPEFNQLLFFSNPSK